ncbi:hypothetical protein BDR06DRAFT_969494 [Suillus hirtellus]|nr:hypothetical protein BDR06DRAFT_969494 [Suillus hirtellus]
MKLSHSSQVAFDLHEVQNTAHVERDYVLAEKEVYQCKTTLAREKVLAENEIELACLTAQYSSKNVSLDISDEHPESPVDKEPQATSSDDARHLLTSLLADVPIEKAMVGMLAEALAKSLQRQQIASHPESHSRCKNADHPVECFTDAQHRNNKANVHELFQAEFHLTRDEDYMLYNGASQEVVISFIDGRGPSLDPLMLQWDIMATHTSWSGTNRVLSCRNTKFETCLKVTLTLLSDWKVTQKDDLPVWKYLHSIVETLDKDGMSSDKSDIDKCQVQAL